MAVPEWLPDWHSKQGYPVPEEADGWEWAWEFLRRNVKYQQLYKRYREALISEFGEQAVRNNDYNTWSSSTREATDNFIFLENSAKNFGLFGFTCPSASVDDVKFNTVSAIHSFVRCNKYTPSEFGKVDTTVISCDPRLIVTNQDCLDEWETAYESLFKLPAEDAVIIKYDTNLADPQKLTFSLDLTDNIKEQLRAIQKLGSIAQKTLKDKRGISVKRKINPHDSLRYLRIYDAYVVEPNRAKIASYFYPELPDEYPDFYGRGRIKNHYNRASELINGGYKKYIFET